MTDVTDPAPEPEAPVRIWLTDWSSRPFWAADDKVGSWETEFIRADLADAALAAVTAERDAARREGWEAGREAAARAVEQAAEEERVGGSVRYGYVLPSVAKRIRALAAPEGEEAGRGE